jgi:hypothetical protein
LRSAAAGRKPTRLSEHSFDPAVRTFRELRVIAVSDSIRTLRLVMLEEENRFEPAAQTHDTVLPATLTFVLLMGVTFLILWFGVFVLLKERW